MSTEQDNDREIEQLSAINSETVTDEIKSDKTRGKAPRKVDGGRGKVHPTTSPGARTRAPKTRAGS